MLPRNHPDRIRIVFDDHRLVANAGLLLLATLARHLGLRELVDHHLDLGGAPGRANTGDKLMTLVASAMAGGDCIDDADVLPSFARGLYTLEATLIDDGTERCMVSFDVRVGEFGGPVATAAVATTAVAGAGALVSVPLTSNDMNARLKLEVQLQRRRPTGWRRILPIPAWKRTIISTLIDAITGLATAVVLQQAGQAPLSITTAISGLVAGGGLTFGMGYSLGVLRTFLRPPELPEEQA